MKTVRTSKILLKIKTNKFTTRHGQRLRVLTAEVTTAAQNGRFYITAEMIRTYVCVCVCHISTEDCEADVVQWKDYCLPVRRFQVQCR